MKKSLFHSLGSFGQKQLNENNSNKKMKTSFNFLRVSQLLLLVLLTFFTKVNAASTNQYVTLNEKNVSLEKVLLEIRSQTGYDFIYNARLLKDSKPVTIVVQNEFFKKVLEDALKDQPLTYTIIENTIVLKKVDKIKITAEPNLFNVPSNIKQVEANSIVIENKAENKAAMLAAKGAIVGQVTDAKGDPLAGVSIMIKGTQIGTNTDATGNYSINIQDNVTLVFSYVGYVSQEIAPGNKATINVKLAESNTALNEVVVTAFGVNKNRRGLGYAVQEVGGKDFTEGRMNNIASALSGKIAGVDAVQTNAGAGASSRVTIRGNTSLNGNQQPLYVVDGMPIDNQNRGPVTSSTQLNVDRGDGISSINPDDIASISVLKGGAAAALYGSQAANGVVLITTKKGVVQKGIGVEYTTDMNQGTPYIFPNFQYEYGQGNDGIKPATAAAALSSGRLSYGAKMDGSSVMQFDGVARPYSPVNVKDNILNFYQPSQNILNSVSLSAGTNKLAMNFSEKRST